MRNRNYNSNAALEVKIDYVESKLDETVRSLKEAIGKSESKFDEAVRSLKEAIDKSEARLEADRQASERRLSEERKVSDARLAEERKESRATRRALNANFIGVIALIVMVFGLVVAVLNG